MDGRKRGKPTLHLEGVTVNIPLIIEVVDEQAKLAATARVEDDCGRQRLSNHTRNLRNLNPDFQLLMTAKNTNADLPLLGLLPPSIISAMIGY